MRTRTLVVAATVSVAAVAAMVLVRRTGRPERAGAEEDSFVRAIVEKGGSAARDEDAPGKPVVKVRLGRKHITDADIEPLGAMTDLVEVRLQGTSVTDAGLRHLRPLRQLRILDLRGTPITDAGLAELRHHPLLETLILIETNVTDGGLKEVVRLNRLQRLEVPSACLTPRGFHIFCDLGLVKEFPGLVAGGDAPTWTRKDIRALQFPPLRLSTAPIAEWEAEMPSLRALEVQARLVTDDVLRSIARQAKLHMLEVIASRPILGVAGNGPDEEQGNESGPGRDEDITKLVLNDCPITDASLDILLGLKRLESLELDHTKLSPAGVAGLARLPHLTHLSVRGIPMTAGDLRAFRDCPNLTLEADYEVSDAGLKAYREAGVLHLLCTTVEEPDSAGRARTLNLDFIPITDAGLAALAGDPAIVRLDLGHTAVTDDGLKHLGRLTGLSALRLSGTRVTGRGLKHLAGLPGLTSLNLSDTQVTDADLKELLALKQLRRLDLSETKVTGAGLTELAKLTALRQLNLSLVRATEEQLHELRVALPDCEIKAYILGLPH